MSKISDINAIQVFDSRGIPTISCKITLDNGVSAFSMVPSGASTGTKEAVELRDNDKNYKRKFFAQLYNKFSASNVYL